MECQEETKAKKKCRILSSNGKYCYLHQQVLGGLPLFFSLEFVSKKSTSGKLFMFGDGKRGQLGMENVIEQPIPAELKLVGKVKMISCGQQHTAVITEKGKLFMFGYNINSQLGTGNQEDRLVPTEVIIRIGTDMIEANKGAPIENGLKVAMVNCGNLHTAVITEDGKLFMFGNNDYGQLGTGDNIDRYNPTEITSVGKVKQVSCGTGHTGVITEDDRLFMFGHLVGTEYEYVFRPTEITSVGKVKMVSCGNLHTAVITQDDKLFMFGNNGCGQLGTGILHSYVPTEVIIRTGTNMITNKVTMVSCGNLHTAVITEDDMLFMFGYGKSGQLGTGDEKHRPIPTEIMKGTKVKMVSSGYHQTAVIDKNDSLYMFGGNDGYQLGTGDKEKRLLPTKITTGKRVKMVSCGWYHTGIIC